MKNIFYITTGDYKEKPIMAFDNYNDALHCAAAYKDYADDDAKKLVHKLPMCGSQPRTIDMADLDSVIDMTIKACASANQAKE